VSTKVRGLASETSFGVPSGLSQISDGFWVTGGAIWVFGKLQLV
jgi:hypothetical protein